MWSFGTVTARNPGNGDPFFYHAQANMLADGVGFGEPIQWLTEGRFVPSAIHPPLFTLWLTPASLLGARGYLSHKTMAALAGVAVIVVAALLARRLAGDRAGVLAAIGVALYPNLFIIDGTLWPEGLYTATVGLALVLAYRWKDGPTYAAGRPCSARRSALPSSPAARRCSCCRCCACRWRCRVGSSRRAGGPTPCVMGVVALGILAPWTIRNLVRVRGAGPGLDQQR